jgi:uncharacterized Ntn-hydrolase superfamily protein
MSISLRRAALVLVAILCTVRGASATWSIVLADRATGETALGCATCITGIDLKPGTAMVKVGAGAGATQCLWLKGEYRMTMFEQLAKGTDPHEILDMLLDLGGTNDGQMGLADLAVRSETFTESACGTWRGGRAGSVGTVSYAVQGNIMVGESVITAAERAVITTRGTLADRLMAGMEAARAEGGDSRCTPVGKSSAVAYMIVTRMGDIDALCSNGDDCANGTYYLDLDVSFQKKTDPDPVFTLAQRLKQWRDALVGRPDHLESRVSLQPQRLPANGHSTATMTILLSDWQGIPIMHGGAAVRVQHQQDSAGSSFIGSVQDHGDGTYTVPITAGFAMGTDLFQVTVDDGITPVQLYPFASLDVAPPLSLRASETEISAAAGDDVRFGLASTTGFAGREFLLLLSASGTEPGFDHGRVHVPLNADAALFNSLMFANSPPYLGTRSKLDADGRASAVFAPDPGMLDPLVGATLSFAYLTLSPDDFCSRPVQILIVP